MTEYTPTTEKVHYPFVIASGNRAFRSWLAEHDRQVAAEALRQAANDWQFNGWTGTPRHANRVADRMAASQYALEWMRARAQAIEEGRND